MLTPEQKAALDVMFVKWTIYDRAKSDVEFVQPKVLGIKDYIPHIERLLADPACGPAVAAYHYRENCQQMLTQIQARWPTPESEAAAIQAVAACFPELYDVAGLTACLMGVVAALTGLASATPENIAAVAAEIRADFSLLWE